MPRQEKSHNASEGQVFTAGGMPTDGRGAAVFDPEVVAVLADRYTIQREIGRGGGATVYVADDTRHPRQVAIKVLRLDDADDVSIQRFQREIAIVAGLEHPHIVQLYDSGRTDDLLYFVMPFVEGGSLLARLGRERQLAIPDAISVARDIAEALDYAHARGVVHRDVKPANILLDVDHARLTDFGIARSRQPRSERRITLANMSVGTPEYMAPEQITAEKNIDGRCDLYALACVVYEMLAGDPPFTGPVSTVLAKHQTAAVPDLRTRRSTVSDDMQVVIERALAKAPADRFATTREFVGALESAAPLAKVARRRRVRIGPLGAVLLLPVILGLGIYWGVRRPDVSSERANAHAPVTPRIAVLYPDDRTADASLRRVRDALTEGLIDELSAVSAFRVVPRTSVRPYRDRDVPLDSMIAALNASTVIDGSIDRAADSVRISIQLIDAQSATYLDSVSLVLPIADTVRMKQSAARRVAAEIRRRLGHQAHVRQATLGTSSPAAAMFATMARRARDDAEEMAVSPDPADVGSRLDALERADSLLTLAERADPAWLRPLLDRGWVALTRAELLTGPAGRATCEQGLRLSEEALRLAPQNAEAHALRGALLFWPITESGPAPLDTERLRRGEADLRAAVAEDSTLARAWTTLSLLLWAEGSQADANLAARHALRADTYLDEASDVFAHLFSSALMLGDFGQAGSWCERGRETTPNDWRFVECELTLMRHEGRNPPNPSLAWSLVRQLERMDPGARAQITGRPYQSIYRRMVAAAISARAGQRSVAEAELARATLATKGDSALHLDLAYDEAYLRLVLGERHRAYELISALIRARPVLRPFLARDPLFRELRSVGGLPR